MFTERATLYRGLLRELRQSVVPPRKVNKTIIAYFRSTAEKIGKDDNIGVRHDFENAILFIRSQREHKRLLERYNPLFDLTAEERIKATARRVEPNKIDFVCDSFLMFISRLRQIYARYMAPADFTTQVLKCDPSSITFLTSSDYPQISSQETLDALKFASQQLVDFFQPVVFPTETVYGLGALALDPNAASKIFSIKGRPPDNPLIVHVSSFTMLRSLLPPGYVIPRSYQVLMKHFWPGALTLLFPRNHDVVPSIITAGQHTVAIRMPSHPVARALIAMANVPLAAPSANTSGKPSPTRAEHVHRDLDGKVGLILDGGACGVGLESTVADGLHADGNIRVLRPGGITVEDIERSLSEDLGNIPKILVHKRDYADKTLENAPTTPGMKYRHYSPSVPLVLLLTLPTTQPCTAFDQYIHDLRRKRTEGLLKIGMLAPTDSKLWDQIRPCEDIVWYRYELGPVKNPSVIAHNLFDGLLSLDKAGVHLMMIEEVKKDREGLAIMNRVCKAASESIQVTLE